MGDAEETLQRLLKKSEASEVAAKADQQKAFDKSEAEPVNTKNYDATKKRVDTGVSLDAALTDPDDVKDKNRIALADASQRDLLGPDEFIGPPQAQWWDKFDAKQKLDVDRAVETIENAKTYDSAPHLFGKFKKDRDEVEANGGIDTKETATMLARYRMAKQGMQPVTGPRIKREDRISGDYADKESRYDSFVRGKK